MTEPTAPTPQSSPAPAEPSPSPAPAAPVAASPAPEPSPAPTKAERPAYIPEKFWDGEKGEVRGEQFAEHYSVLTSRDAERVAREAAVPPSPDKYEVRLPKDFKVPEGMEFQFNNDDPALKYFREIAHKRGLDQETFDDAMGAFAAVKVAELQQQQAQHDSYMQKLGATGPQRLDAIETWLTAKVGDKANALVATLKQFPHQATVEAFEGIIRAFSSQGGTTFDQRHREGAEDAGKIPGFEKMSFEQRRHAQEQQRQQRRTA